MAYIITVKPRSEREAIIANSVEASTDFGEMIYDFRSGTYTPKVIALPIDLPVYRMENCRAFSAQQTEIARQEHPKDFFEKGQEFTTAQTAQHEILIRLANQGTESVTPIIDVLRKDGQRENILITSTGVVVNGNRRLAAMRELCMHKDGSADLRFSYVRCAILPSDVTRDEIDDIEADLQAKLETKLDYDWIGDAQLIRRQVGKNRSIKQVADRLRRSKTDIENVLQALDEADLYMSEWLEKPGEYDLVQAGQQIFGDLPKAIANKDVGLQNASRAIAWAIYENRDKISGRVYRLNLAFGKLAPKVLEILEDQLNLPINADDVEIEEDDFVIDIDADNKTKDYTPIIEVLRTDTSTDEVINVLVDACETAIELDKGQKNEHEALKVLGQVNSKVIGLDVSYAGKKALPAMLKQIESIRKCLDKIEAAITARLKGGCSDNEEEE